MNLQATYSKNAPAAGCATALRDGVLQDLLAVSMLVKAAQERIAARDADAASELLGDAALTLMNDLKGLRTVIRELDGTRSKQCAVTGR